MSAAAARGAFVVRLGSRAGAGPGPVSVGVSLAAHVALLLIVRLVAAPAPTAPTAVAVRLVASLAEPPRRAAAASSATPARPVEPVPSPELPEPPPRDVVPLGPRDEEPDVEPLEPDVLEPPRREPPEKPKPKPKPKPRPPRPAPASAAPQGPTGPAAPEPVRAEAGGVAGSAEGAEVGHPYLQRLVRQVSRSWVKPRSGLPARAAVVRFEVGADGTVRAVQLEQSSGVRLYDRSALRAVQLASPLPPLPADSTGDTLTVHFEFIP